MADPSAFSHCVFALAKAHGPEGHFIQLRDLWIYNLGWMNEQEKSRQINLIARTFNILRDKVAVLACKDTKFTNKERPQQFNVTEASRGWDS